jgi:Outer membrane lipoprotein-sorting protein
VRLSCLQAQEAIELPETPVDAEAEKRSAEQILSDCTRVIPTDPVVLKGTMTVKKGRTTVLSENDFALMLDWGANPPSAECILLEAKGSNMLERALMTRPKGKSAQIKLYAYQGKELKELGTPSYTARIRGTDMTWLDLTLDFLWWKDVRFDDVPRGKSWLGRDCHILLVSPPDPIPGCSAVRVWVDVKLCCVMQSEQLDPQGNPVRKMWVQRVKKMLDDRWMIREMEIETLNSGHRTSLFVDSAEKP